MTDNDKVSFEELAKIIDASIQIGQPTVSVIAQNDSGKSHLMDFVFKRHQKHGYVTDRIDTGGIRDFRNKGMFGYDRIRTVGLTDFNLILSRRVEIRTQAIAELCNLVDGKICTPLDYQSTQRIKDYEQLQKLNGQKIPPVNIITNSTYAHTQSIMHTSYNDWLTRNIFLFVEREAGFKTENIDFNEFKQFDRQSEDFGVSRREKWSNAIEQIEQAYHMKIPYHVWNIEKQEFVLTTHMVNNNKNMCSEHESQESFINKHLKRGNFIPCKVVITE